jgi:hypothetical protein
VLRVNNGQCHLLSFIFKPFMLNVIMLNDIMLSVVTLNVVAPWIPCIALIVIS